MTTHQSNSSAQTAAPRDLLPTLRDRPIPLAPAQERLWLLDQLDPVARSVYITSVSFELRGALDVAALRAALDALVKRHESLRTTFTVDDDQPVQHVAPANMGWPLTTHDLGGASAEAQAAKLAELNDAEAKEPFNLTTGPLIRGRLLNLDADRHVLLLTLHDIVSDGWSIGILMAEMSTLYAAFNRGVADPLPRLTIQFADYAMWQSQWLKADALRVQADFWKEQLAGAPVLLALPTDHPRPATPSYVCHQVAINFSPKLSERLRNLGQRHSVTFETILMAGWSVLLSRLSGQSDLVIGTSVANRPRAELKHVAGRFANTLALRVRFDANPTVAELLEQVKAVALKAYAHQDIPFAQVVEAVHPVRSLSYNPLFQAMLTVDEGMGHRVPEFSGVTVTRLEPTQSGAPFDVLLTLRDTGERIDGCLVYASDLFDRSTIERMLDQLRVVFEAMTADDAQRVSTLPLLSTAALHELLVGFNTRYTPAFAQTEQPAGQSIPGLFEAQVKRTPDLTAVAAAGRTLTYDQLNRQANQLAHHLIALGVRPDDRVAICMERGLELLVAILAVLKAGGAYVPLDPQYPAQRLSNMVEDCQPIAFVTQAGILDRVPAGSPSVVVLDVSGDYLIADSLFNNEADTNPDAGPMQLTAGHLAYVIYTSGSTGRPKGAMVERGALLNLLQWYTRELALATGDAVLVVTSHCFDLTQKNLLGPLLLGGTVHLGGSSFDPAAILEQVSGAAIRVMNLTPSMFHALIDADKSGSLSVLRQVVLGGEPIQPLKLLELPVPRPEFINSYGPTECTDVVLYHRMSSDLEKYRDRSVPIGKPLPNTAIYILDPVGQPVPIGVTGEIFIGDGCVSRGYLNRAELTAERFLPDPFSNDASARMYKTGDLGRWLVDGEIDYLGRNDFQVKVHGFRIELGEIEAQLMRHPQIREAAVLALDDASGNKRLVAYYIVAGADRTDEAAALGDPDMAQLRAHLLASLPDYMVPTAFMRLDAMPLTPNGKLDRRALPLPAPQRPELAEDYAAPRTDDERAVCAAFAEILQLDRVGIRDSFFELGGRSLIALRVLGAIKRLTGSELGVGSIFAHPTPEGLARLMREPPVEIQGSRTVMADSAAGLHAPVAIIGMAGRFPGASSVEGFWKNLLDGRDCITRFTPATLDPSVPASLREDPDYVWARGIIEGVEDFDAPFFSMPPREAEVTDPQHRVFLELAWECLERAGYAPDRTTDSVGVFAGAGTPAYLQNNVLLHAEAIDRVGALQVQLANDKDYIATRVAYKLNLKGPAINVNTACSSSLVAVAQAIDSLRLGRCGMALAGAASISSPPRTGYLAQDGAMLAGDGLTRSFDAAAEGTAFNDGAAVVLLKPLAAALADGDQIYAVIRGASTNNDGGGKASFSAPSVDGQAAVIAAAHRDAGVAPREISYIEAHGTATPLGDPVEVEALTRAFRLGTRDTGFCRIGSVKSNVGHLVAAAGTVSLIKTALALHEETLPATIHFQAPNPRIDFATSPFVVTDRQIAWPRTSTPRRAGISSFGVGGTNAHVILEEAPFLPSSEPAVGPQLLCLSAKNQPALDVMALELSEHLNAHPGLNLADVAHTLQVGRSSFPRRLAVVGNTVAQVAAALRTPGDPRRSAGSVGASLPPLIWLFPGQGVQYAGMGSSLYALDSAFREAFDECAAAMADTLSFDLKARVFDLEGSELTATGTTQPAIFCLEYALARAWIARGCQPTALIGHSVGEFVAAVISGVMTLADAARLVALRGTLMEALPAGGMLAVRLSGDEVRRRLPDGLCLAADNGPKACVVAGPKPLLDVWRTQLETEAVGTRALQTSHAFHSSMMDPAVEEFERHVRGIILSAPVIPVVSTLTGRWMTFDDATDPSYWSRHLRETVQFSPAIRTALGQHDGIFLELGPRGTLSTLARQHSGVRGAPLAIPSLGDAPDAEGTQWMLALGQLWTLGYDLPCPAARPSARRQRVLLPTYAFQRKRLWLEARTASGTTDSSPIYTGNDQSPSFSAGPPIMPSAPVLTASISRRSRLNAQLRGLFEDVTGTDLATAEGSAGFLELGLDSLSLTQAALQVKRTFKVALTFRQLMETYRSFDALTEFLDSSMAPDDVPAAPLTVATTAPAPTAPTAPPSVMPFGVLLGTTAVADSVLHAVIQQQMQLMAQQLALLSGAPSPAAAAAAVPVNTVAAMTPSAPAPRALPESPVAANEEGGAIRYDVKKAFGAIARIHTQKSQLTDRQRARLGAFVRRYIDRTKQSREYTVQNRSQLADPRVVNGFRPMTKEITYQIVVNRSKGSRVWDLDGNEYIDVLSGFGMNMFGWQPDFVQAAVREQLDLGYEIGPQHPLAGEVASLVCEITGFDRAGLCNTGSEAVMAAIRIARTVTGRNTVVLFTGSYHGTFDEVLVRAGRGGKGIPAAPGIMAGMFSDVRVLDYGTPESLEFIRTHADDLAAVLVEPVQSRRPEFQPKEFLKEVRAITARSGTCFIFDEVITGFRSHLGGVQSLFGIRADLACYGKVIGGGFPVGVVAGTRDYMDSLDGGAWRFGDDSMPTVGVTYFAGTFVRHPLALAAAKASLVHLKENGPELQRRLNSLTETMANEINAFCREVGAPLEIRHFASLWRVAWHEDHPLQDLLFAMMRSRGIHILDNFPCFMTTAHSLEDIAAIKKAFRESVAELQESDFLPGRPASVTAVDSSRPPVPNARLGRDKDGKPAWFAPDASAPGKYVKVSVL